MSEHTNHVRLTTSELTPAVLEGAAIYGADDHKVGKVDHIHGAGAGGSAVMRDEDGDVHAVTSWTKDEFKQMPEYRDWA
ncbi:PRC-barrel domain containing protein [Rhizobium laguerreae]|uniref:PRC-barrel domain containing protein n=1 Tax=Rhizobium laguerreae TaxID=1076926 RepID=UPI00103ECA19|nr:PRC-barrel domain containing protein [Rhizobium laguerreae]MBY3397515.1 PRC-barrel domain containing protein [Rhizobium laguerreae]MBY3423893.1 PRC-barrel domain containing protein [Rhizobium laguerreae]MBY3475883.1 PRC-barrel domain containing protein [Rhizobium laguerreae]MBY3496615.1 PRC-barrel domain containing protein [Rhizobium laguerreae]MBY3523820.1 PRC-barrel domain containing protein [Rhizobium laguerreae]